MCVSMHLGIRQSVSFGEYAGFGEFGMFLREHVHICMRETDEVQEGKRKRAREGMNESETKRASE